MAPPAAPEPRFRRFGRAALLGGLVLAGVAHALRFHPAGPHDDGYIDFRYARNLATGKGYVFNPGERVDGTSGPAWILLLAAGDAIGFVPENASRAIGIAAVAATILAASAAARALVPAAGAAPGLLAAAFLAADPSLAVHAVSGLNTLLLTAIGAGSLALFLRAWTGGRRAPLSAFALAGLAPAVRSEGAVVVACLLGWDLLRSRRLDRRALVALALAAAPFFWRFLYFGDPFPNTYYAKKGDLARDLADGWTYAKAWLLSPRGALLAAGALALVAGRVRPRGPGFAALGLALAWTAFAVWVGGDSFEAHRLFVPVLPAAAILGAAGTVGWTRALAGPAAGRALLEGACAAAVAMPLFRPSSAIRDMNRFAHDVYDARWNAVGRALRMHLRPDCLVATSPIGAIGYRSEVAILDMLGLTDPHIARLPPFPGALPKGHQKFDAAYVMARRPDLLVLGNALSIPPGDPEGKVPRLFWEEGIWRERDFQTDYERVVLDVPGNDPAVCFPLVCFRRRDSDCGR